MAALPDGRIVSGSYDNTLRIWNSTSGECEVVLEGHSNINIGVSDIRIKHGIYLLDCVILLQLL